MNELDKLKEKHRQCIKMNKHSCGELGEFIREEYANNILSLAIDEAFALGQKDGSAGIEKISFNAYLHGRKEQAKDKWVSVEERLPRVTGNGYSDTVLVWELNEIRFAQFLKENKYVSWVVIGRTGGITVTHWQPLPEPPNKNMVSNYITQQARAANNLPKKEGE